MAGGVKTVDNSEVDTVEVDTSELLYEYFDNMKGSSELGNMIREILLQSLVAQQQIWILGSPLMISLSPIEKRWQIVLLQSSTKELATK